MELKINYLSIAVAFLLTSLVACKKETEQPQGHHHDHGAAVSASISIANPTAGAMYMHGDTVHMNVSITGSGELHGYELLINNNSHNNANVYSVSEHNHTENYTIQDFWVNNVSHHSDMQLIVKAFVTHDGDFESDTVNFHCHPM